MHAESDDVPGILAIQNNNIGDLVLATPVLAELRRRFPDARLDVLASAYNAPVLDGNPNVDAVHIYTKRKHLDGQHPPWHAHLRNARLLHRLREAHYDFVLLLSGCATPKHLSMARWLAPRLVVGFHDALLHGERTTGRRGLWLSGIADDHVVPRSLALLSATLGATHAQVPSVSRNPCVVFPDASARERLHAQLREQGLQPDRPLVALQISARRPRQRWGSDRFVDLVRRLHDDLNAQILLLWSPGAADAVTHPGDDDMAAAIAGACRGLPVFPLRTSTLRDLIAGLSLADAVVSPDGGAMHLAAALDRPVVALFGDSDPQRWHPWCGRHLVLRPASRHVRDILPDEAADAVRAVISPESATHEDVPSGAMA